MSVHPTPVFRDATLDDLDAIIQLLADDVLGSTRESVAAVDAYRTAFDAIAADPNNRLIVADIDGTVMGTLQLTYIPGLTYTGGERAQIEGVRIAGDLRGRGVGQQMLNYAIEEARTRGCRVVQLTSDRQRPEALRFYQKLGFRPSHMGLKYPLREP
ncbi:GNAT family N-acetyltransferase [Actinocorallia longicatena]|uniref:GNAT family N-acetyltransferase n=1 Tax=Actinocorallia longicatena TaxID=111803 RepID=A0ABP6QIN1_9ACTN